MGDVSDTRKQILQNTLTDELKKYFRIVPQEKYEQVLEQVFEELEYEECSEDQCIMRVQEMLQVENVFNLQIIGEGKDSQLNLKWITLDEKKNEEDYCKGCGTFELREMIGGLVEKLVGEKKVEVVVEKPIVVVEKLVGEKKVEVVVEKPIVEEITDGKGVFYSRYVNGIFGWYKSGDEKKDDKYVGEIEDGKPNGQGTYSFPDGSSYEGDWKDDKYYEGEYHGQGTYTYPDGRMYVGEFKDGEKNGQGTYTYPYGNKYVGEYKDGEKNGQGTYSFPDGEKYEGEFKDDKRNGQGTLTYPNGEKYVGEFKDGKTWNGTGYDKSGNIEYKYVNGVKQ